MTYRVDAAVLDVDALYVDVTYDGTDPDGTVHLVEAVDTDPRSWTIDSFTDWQTYIERNRIADHADLDAPDDAMWTILSDAYVAAGRTPHSGAVESVRASVHDAFTTLVDEHTS